MEFEKKQNLLKAALEGELVLFLGSGVVAGSHVGKEKTPAYLGLQLAEKLAKEFFPTDPYKNESLKRICTEIENIKGKEALISSLSELLLPVLPSEYLKIIPEILWSAIFTVNVDNSLEESYRIRGAKVQNLIPIVKPHDSLSESSNYEVSYFKLHGCLITDPYNVIFSQKDYTESREKFLKLFSNLKSYLCEKPFLFIGFGFEDDDFLDVWENIKKYLGLGRRLQPTFLIYPEPPTRFVESMKTEGITVINSNTSEFLPWLKANIPGRLPSINEKTIEKTSATRKLIENEYSISIPHDQLDRLKKFGEIVSHIPSPSKIPAQSRFLLGENPDWDDIKLGLPIKRELREDILVDLDDWNSSGKVKATLILGPAGYGKTTLMMDLANQISNTEGLFCLWVKDPIKFDPICVVEIIKSIGLPAVIFIDDSYRCISSIKNLYQDCKDNKIKAFILAASRPSDWNVAKQTSSLENLNSIQLERLSVIEAENLAQIMKKSGKLNSEFSTKPIEELKTHYLKASECHMIAGLMTSVYDSGSNFEEIIANEFFKIDNDIAKNTYLISSIVHSLGLCLPFLLFCRCFGIDINRYREFYEILDGIVIEQKDEDSGDLRLKTQHRVIAETLIENVLQPSKANELLLIISTNINQHSKYEYNIFYELYNEYYLEIILKEPGYIRSFYENIVSEFPSDPFILQHWAIYESKMENFPTAKKLIDEGISKLDDNQKSYFHFTNTKGIIWLREAISEENKTKSEYLFKRGSEFIREQIKNDPDKEIHYISLIDKFFSFSQKQHKDSEKLLIYEEIENDLEKALMRYPNSSDLLALSGRLAVELSKFPKAKGFLETSLSINKGNVKARVLLVRIHIKNEKYNYALETIEEGLSYNPKSSSLRKLKIDCLENLSYPWDEKKPAFLEYLKIVKNDIFYRLKLIKGLIENKEFPSAKKQLDSLKKIDMSFSTKKLTKVQLLSEGHPMVVTGIYQAKRLGKGFVQIDGFPAGMEAFLELFNMTCKTGVGNGSRLRMTIGLNGFGLYVKEIIE